LTGKAAEVGDAAADAARTPRLVANLNEMDALHPRPLLQPHVRRLDVAVDQPLGAPGGDSLVRLGHSQPWPSQGRGPRFSAPGGSLLVAPHCARDSFIRPKINRAGRGGPAIRQIVIPDRFGVLIVLLAAGLAC